MSIYNDKSLKSVADAVAKIMQNEELKGNQHKIDANQNGKVDAHDFKLLRAKKKTDKPVVKEQVQLDEAFPTVADAQKRHEQGKTNFEKKKISTGTVYQRKAEPDTDEKPKKKKMSEMIDMYNQIGLKAIAEVKMQEIQVVNADLANGYEEAFVEEASSEEFKKELEDEKAKADGKKKQPDVAKASVQAVANEEVELDERELTASEKDKKEENVKGMKKGLSGFKERYGKDAKSVMYATATKMAKGE
jgi:hypothetical protein